MVKFVSMMPDKTESKSKLNFVSMSFSKQPVIWHDLIDIKTLDHEDPSIILCKRIPKPLHGVNPRSILTQIDPDWWNRTRTRIYEAYNLHCMCCGVEKSKQKGFPKYLDAHELYDIDYTTGRVTLNSIVALCRFCHSSIHFGRLTAEYERGGITEKQYYQVLQHANMIIEDNNYPKKTWDVKENDNLVANIPWDKWHLELTINGEVKKFYSNYESEDAIDKHYENTKAGN